MTDEGHEEAKAHGVGIDHFPYNLTKSILTPAELSFYRVLVVSLDSWYIVCPKVRLGDVFSLPRRKEDRFYRYKINQKHVDFLMCIAWTMEPVLGIELDDSTHDRKVREQRDHFVDDVYESAGLPLLHIRATATYDANVVASLVRDAVRKKFTRTPADAHIVNVPNCPKCGVKMLIRWAKKGRNKGDAFWGCPKFPACDQIARL